MWHFNLECFDNQMIKGYYFSFDDEKDVLNNQTMAFYVDDGCIKAKMFNMRP
jgi:hypothetical protein